MTKPDLPAALGGTPLSEDLTWRWPVPSPRSADHLHTVLASSTWSSGGPLERQFERGFAELHDAEYGVCVANGTVSLQLALEALDVGAGAEVVVPGYTWQATAGAVLDVNAVPVLVDIDIDTLCLDPEALQTAITARTRAVIAVHLYDNVADLTAITAITDAHGISLIEDCAHGHGSQWNGIGVGSHGRMGSFSFQTSKQLTAGEGGLILTRDDELRDRLRSLRNCGRPAGGSSQRLQSGNYRMTEWQAAVLLAQLEEFPRQLDLRQEALAFLDDALDDLPGLTVSKRDPQVTRRGVYAYPFRYDAAAFDDLPIGVFRSALSEDLGVPLRTPYRPLHRSDLYRPRSKARHRISAEYWAALDPTRFDLPTCEAAYETVVTLPHPLLLNPIEKLAAVPRAIRRIRRHATALARWGRGQEEWFPE